MNAYEIKETIKGVDSRIQWLETAMSVIGGRTQKSTTIKFGDQSITITDRSNGYLDAPRLQYRELARYIRNGLADERRSMLAKKRDLQLQLAKALRAEADKLAEEASILTGVGND